MSKRKRPEISPAFEIRRKLNEILAEVRSAEYGSQLGLLRVAGQISAPHYNAGKKWAVLVRDYAAATQSPRQPRSAILDAQASQPADPDSPRGRRQAACHRRIVASYAEALNVLQRAGCERVVDSVCVADHAPTQNAELELLKRGLSALNHFWAEQRRAAAVRWAKYNPGRYRGFYEARIQLTGSRTAPQHAAPRRYAPPRTTPPLRAAPRNSTQRLSKRNTRREIVGCFSLLYSGGARQLRRLLICAQSALGRGSVVAPDVLISRVVGASVITAPFAEASIGVTVCQRLAVAPTT